MTIRDYCNEKQITLTEFAKITGISQSHAFAIQRNPDYNIRRDMMQKIYKGTKERFGEGLLPHEYLNIK